MRFVHMRRIQLIALLLLCSGYTAWTQVVGGVYSFEYLRMPTSPHVSALGGICVSNPEQDISFVAQNPALMRPGLHNQLGLNYNSYYAGIGLANMAYGYYVPKLQTAFSGAVQYINYGTFTQTDASGNDLGSFRATDYAVSLTASRQYLERWRYGATMKFAGSKLYQYPANALLLDVGVNYYDTANLIDVGIVAKNMGATIRKYNTSATPEPLPFDVQIGISKRFKHMPLRFIATAHHLYQWDIRYNNPTDNISTSILGGGDTVMDTKSHVVNKFFRHFIFAGELKLGKHMLVDISYNVLKRQELAVKSKPGAAGFAFGFHLNYSKLSVHYARTFYHVVGAYNEFGINMPLQKYVSSGRDADKPSQWDATYENW